MLVSVGVDVNPLSDATAIFSLPKRKRKKILQLEWKTIKGGGFCGRPIGRLQTSAAYRYPSTLLSVGWSLNLFKENIQTTNNLSELFL
jgi:hypothetical protein